MNETLKRALSGIVYVALLILSMLYNADSFYILFGVFLFIAVTEYCEMVKIPFIFPVLIALATYYGNYKYKIDAFYDLVLLGITLIVFIKALFFLFDSTVNQLSLFSKTFYFIGYIVFPFICITKIPFGINGYNPKILISIFILIWTNDTFAYLVGKSIGRTKLLERVSPKKTIEGFIGGVLFTIIASIFISKYYIEVSDKNQYIWIIIALIVGIFGTIGDLVESKFKRIAGIKDSGKIMPGHGGILDRLDSVIFVAPIVFLFYKILNYVS
jgi:phosphatidate cytidylyltransferase